MAAIRSTTLGFPVLASHGYIVAAPYHYRANTYDSTIAYLANKLWQRPIDINLEFSFLSHDPYLRKFIDASKIGVAGHSQGGFTAIWLGGAKINSDKYLALQRCWRNNFMVQKYLRNALPLDAGPALHVHDNRIEAVFAMAPGVFEPFGMDAVGLRQSNVPTYIIVGAGDTQTPPKSNAAFAAKYIRYAQLYVIPGRVDHEKFVNEYNEEGKDELPEACIDAPGVDRAKVHETIGDAALQFFRCEFNGAPQKSSSSSKSRQHQLEVSGDGHFDSSLHHRRYIEKGVRARTVETEQCADQTLVLDRTDHARPYLI